MRILFLVVCWWICCATGARLADSSSTRRASRRIYAEEADVDPNVATVMEELRAKSLARSKKRLKAVKRIQNDQRHPYVGVTLSQQTVNNNEEPPKERQLGFRIRDQRGDPGPEDDSQCVMHVDQLASVMMKKNTGEYKIEESEKQKLLGSGWHKVDPEQPGAVKIVCGNKESYIGLANHCLLWKNGKPTMKTEQDITSMLRSDFINTNEGANPNVQKVACDYLRVFYVTPKPKEAKPSEKEQEKVPDNGLGKIFGNLPFNIKNVKWKIHVGQPTAGRSGDSDVVPQGTKDKCEVKDTGSASTSPGPV